MRPIYHHKEVRSDGHLFIIVLAYQCAQFLRVKLKLGGSPDQISGYLKPAYPDCYARNVSHETIYTAL